MDNETFAKKNSHKIENSTVTFKKSLGRVHISKLKTTARKYSMNSKFFLSAKPKPDSKLLQEIQEEGASLQIISCQGEWIQVSYKDKKGWFHSIQTCGNPYTNCS